MARESRFGVFAAQLPHSEVDWSVSTEALDAGVCPIPEAGCNGIKGPAGRIGWKLKKHFGLPVHKVILILKFPTWKNLLHFINVFFNNCPSY